MEKKNYCLLGVPTGLSERVLEPSYGRLHSVLRDDHYCAGLGEWLITEAPPTTKCCVTLATLTAHWVAEGQGALLGRGGGDDGEGGEEGEGRRVEGRWKEDLKFSSLGRLVAS